MLNTYYGDSTLAVQKRVVAGLQDRMKSVQRLLVAIDEELKAVSVLPSRLLSMAFDGEI